jgi:hypothetical protein
VWDEFSQLLNIESVTFGDEVKTISEGAFQKSSLRRVIIGKNVTSIGDRAFKLGWFPTVTVYLTEPLAISENTFVNASAAILYVPYRSKAAYEAADYWKDFREIIEMEPVDDGLYFSETEVTATIGEEFTTPTLANPKSLPITWTSSDEQVATVNASGEITLLAAGTTTITAIFAGNDEYEANSVSYTLTVLQNVIPGDANGDGNVNVTDIVEIVNYILGHPSAKFDETAADVNGDGVVNVTDIVSVVNIILSDPVAARELLGDDEEDE